MSAAPSVAGAQAPCPEATPTYTSNCGPTFVVPAWGDAGGWTDPSKYSTIRLADVNGDGKDELIARNDQGIEIYWFDTSLGQWRPQVVQVAGSAVPQALTDFRSPLPNEKPATDWTKPEYYSTIQTANLDGRPGEEVFGRFADGVHAYTYVPPQGTTDINGGSWQGIGGPAGFSDAVGGADPGIYPTIHSGVVQDGTTYIFGRRHPTPDNAGDLGLAVFQDGDWVLSAPKGPPNFAPAPAWGDAVCGQPACYLDVQGAAITTSPPDPHTGYQTIMQGVGQVLSRTSAGVGAWTLGSYDFWFAIGGAPDHAWTSVGPGFDIRTPGPFSDVPGAPDCPFSSNGASGDGSGDCLGSSPYYYETLRTADIDGQPGEELLARASDGLRVKRYNGHGYDSLATVTDLAGAGVPELTQQGLWASIRTGDINGDHKDEVLAITAGGLQAWSYDPGSNTWAKLPGSVGLLADPWLTQPENYATVQVGDVDGDGREDVIARGQFGIRTWFYNRRGTGGWERYLPDGYPDFPTPEQQAALTTLNGRGLGNIRDQWTEGTPDTTTLSELQDKLPGSLVGNCSNQTSLNPPAFGTCTPPAGSTGFTAGDWKTVVNQLLSEAYYAEKVLEQFNDLKTIRDGVFESESGTLPAIAADLQIAGAAGNTATFNMEGYFGGATGIAASIAGLEPVGGPEASAALWVASELFSMLPSPSDTATSTFQTTYAGLLNKFATVEDDMVDQWGSQQQQVLGDQSLLGLVGQLRSSRTWNPDIAGMLSASRQAFALETYQALLPTMYQRYVVTNCTDQASPYESLNCDLPTGDYVLGKSPNGTWLGPGLSTDPCPIWPPGSNVASCEYGQNPGQVPASVANIVWGPIADICNYKPPNKNTLWHFSCSLGVPTATSIGADSPGWTFSTTTGDPKLFYLSSARRPVSATPGVVRASTSGARASQAGSSARAERELLAPLRFRGRVRLLRALRLRRARVVVDRTLFEHGRREELARSRTGRRLRPFALRHAGGGVFTSQRRGRPRVRLELRRSGTRGDARIDLRLTRVRTRDIRTLCTVLPARISRAGRPLELETRLRLRDRGATRRITMRQRWRCVRDRKGEFTGIRPIKPKPTTARPGLAVRLGAPRVLASGRRATVLATVANQRRRRPSRVVSSLWDLRVTGSTGGPGRSTGFKQLRAGRSRTVRLTVPVSRGARGRVCVRVVVHATSARGASARRCVRIAGTPRVNGCAVSRKAACHPRRTATPLRAPHRRGMR
jgi:hypothetical protein